MSVTIGIDIDDTQANQKLVSLQTKVDRQVQQWQKQERLITTELVTTNAAIDDTFEKMRIRRLEILSQLSALNQSMGLMIQAVRMGAEATGQTIKPYQSAVLNMIQSTTSIMLATATAMNTTGILAGAGIALAAFAYGFSMVQSANIIATSEDIQKDIDAIVERLRGLENRSIYLAGAGRFQR